MTSINANYIPLPHRAMIKISGSDAPAFLQGLITNDIELLAAQDSIYACMLTPQGKFLFEFFIFKDGENYILDTEKDRVDECVKRLTMYKLRADVNISKCDDLYCYACIVPDDTSNSAENEGTVIIADPRHDKAGKRIYSPLKDVTDKPDYNEYDKHRIRLGLVDGAKDMEIERTTMAEARMDEQRGVSYTKGCYVGQEITARMHHRGLAKKKLIPVHFKDGRHLNYGATVDINGQKIGEIRSHNLDIAMVQLRLEHYEALHNSDFADIII